MTQKHQDELRNTPEPKEYKQQKKISKTNMTLKNRNVFVVMEEPPTHYKHLQVMSKL